MPWLQKRTLPILLLLGFLQTFAQNDRKESISVLKKQLNEIDSLLSDDFDSLARVALDLLDPDDFRGSRNFLIQYHQFNGDYYLQTSRYAEAIKAYEPLLQISSADLEKNGTLRLARAVNDLGIAYMKVGDFDNAKKSHFGSLILYDRFNDPMGGSYNYNNLALIYKELKQTDSAIYFHNQSIKSARLASDTLGVGFNLLNLAVLFTDNKELVKGLDHFHRSLQVFEELGNERMVNAVRRRLGAYYMKIQDYESAKPLLLEVLAYYEKRKRGTQLGVTHNKLAELYDRLHQFDSVIYHVDQALEILVKTNYTKGLGASYFLRGNYYFETGDEEAALTDLRTALSYSHEKWKGEAVSVLGAMAKIYLKQNKPALAIKSYEQALEEVGGDREDPSLLQSYRILSKAYKQVGNPAKALEALEQFNKMKARAINDEKRWEIARIEYRNFLEREQTLQQAEQARKDLEYNENLRSQQFTIYAVIVMLVFVGIVALLYYRSYRIKRTANQFLEEKNSVLKELREKESQLSSEKIASKERELATMAMATHEKNNILNDLKSKIEGIETVNGAPSDLKEIKRSINNSLSLDGSWDSFLHRFEDVHPQFFDQLKSKNQNLTVNDLKLSAYLKIGMNNKEIANVTFLTLGSVKSQINRLKKKLKLGPEDNIRDFILQRA